MAETSGKDDRFPEKRPFDPRIPLGDLDAAERRARESQIRTKR